LLRIPAAPWSTCSPICHDHHRRPAATDRVPPPVVATVWRPDACRRKINLDGSPRLMALPRRPQPDAGPLQGLSHRLGVAVMALGQALTGPAVVVELDGRVELGGRDVLATESDAGLSSCVAAVIRCKVTAGPWLAPRSAGGRNVAGLRRWSAPHHPDGRSDGGGASLGSAERSRYKPRSI
jgi:hypothetical protein